MLKYKSKMEVDSPSEEPPITHDLENQVIALQAELSYWRTRCAELRDEVTALSEEKTKPPSGQPPHLIMKGVDGAVFTDGAPAKGVYAGVKSYTNANYIYKVYESQRRRRYIKNALDIMGEHDHVRSYVPNLCANFDAMQLHTLSFKFAEYTLRDILLMLRGKDGHRWLEVIKRDLWTHLVAGVHFVHGNGLLHLDIKPVNVVFINNKFALSDWGYGVTSWLPLLHQSHLGDGHSRLPMPKHVRQDQGAHCTGRM